MTDAGRHACPHCRTSLRWRLVQTRPAPGERRLLPLHGMAACPDCGGRLYPNPDPMETRWAGYALIPVILFWAGDLLPAAHPWITWAAGISLAGYAIGLLVVYRRHGRHRPVYSATPPDNLQSAKKESACDRS